MDPLLSVLTLPVSGPLSALTWIAHQIAQAAEQMMLDPARIETALRHLERQLDDGRIDEATYDAEEAKLLAELEDITARRAAAAYGTSAEGASVEGASVEGASAAETSVEGAEAEQEDAWTTP